MKFFFFMGCIFMVTHLDASQLGQVDLKAVIGIVMQQGDNLLKDKALEVEINNGRIKNCLTDGWWQKRGECRGADGRARVVAQRFQPFKDENFDGTLVKKEQVVAVRVDHLSELLSQQGNLLPSDKNGLVQVAGFIESSYKKTVIDEDGVIYRIEKEPGNRWYFFNRLTGSGRGSYVKAQYEIDEQMQLEQAVGQQGLQEQEFVGSGPEIMSSQSYSNFTCSTCDFHGIENCSLHSFQYHQVLCSMCVQFGPEYCKRAGQQQWLDHELQPQLSALAGVQEDQNGSSAAGSYSEFERTRQHDPYQAAAACKVCSSAICKCK